MIGAAHAGIIAARRGAGAVAFDEIAFVSYQGTVSLPADASSVTQASPMAVSAGNLLVASVTWMYDSALIGISDTAGNTWHPLTNRTSTPDENANNQLFYAFNAKPHAANYVTATFSPSRRYRMIAVAQYSGVENASDPLVSEDGFITSSGTYFSKDVVVPPEQGSGLIVVGFGTYNAADVNAWAGGVTVRSLPGNFYAWFADMVNVSPGTHTPQFNHSTTYKAVGLALFKPKIL